MFLCRQGDKKIGLQAKKNGVQMQFGLLQTNFKAVRVKKNLGENLDQEVRRARVASYLY